jgi:hypothetical protein
MILCNFVCCIADVSKYPVVSVYESITVKQNPHFYLRIVKEKHEHSITSLIFCSFRRVLLFHVFHDCDSATLEARFMKLSIIQAP